MRALPFGVLGLTLGACGGASDPSLARGQQAIVDGVVDTSDTSIVLVIAQLSGGGQSLCSGEVVSPHVVLTAAHCVDPALIGTGDTFNVFIGDDVNGPQGSNPSLFLSVRTTAYDMAFDPANLNGGHDVGVVVTNAALPRSPLPMHRAPLSQSDVGRSVRLIGFGIDNGADTQGLTAGIRRQATNAIASIDPNLIGFLSVAPDGSITCEGDSGGAAMIDFGAGEELAGITSFGDQTCTANGFDTRVDPYVSFVDGFIAQYDTGFDGGSPLDAGGVPDSGGNPAPDSGMRPRNQVSLGAAPTSLGASYSGCGCGAGPAAALGPLVAAVLARAARRRRG